MTLSQFDENIAPIPTGGARDRPGGMDLTPQDYFDYSVEHQNDTTGSTSWGGGGDSMFPGFGDGTGMLSPYGAAPYGQTPFAGTMGTLMGALSSFAGAAAGAFVASALSGQSGVRTIGSSGLPLTPAGKMKPADIESIAENSLNDYIDVQYHISFSMVSESKAKEYQGGALTGAKLDDLDDEENFKVLASTGNVRGIDDGSMTYLNITELDVEHIMAPSSNNPLISGIPSMKLTIVEPVGATFVDDLRRVANSMGYAGISSGRIGYRVDIYFSGFDAATGQWIERLPLDSSDDAPTSITYFLSISDVQAMVTPAGTTYEVSLVPNAALALRPEDFVLYAGSVFVGTTFGEFLVFLKQRLEKEKYERTSGQVIRTYDFYAPKELLDATMDTDTGVLADYQFLFDPAISSKRAVANGANVDLQTLLRGILANINYVQEGFVSDSEDGNFTTPRVTWRIRPNVKYGQVDEELNDYKDIAYEFYIEPFISFQGSATSKDNQDNLVKRDHQKERYRKMVQFGMLKRAYTYLNSPTNVDVLSMNLNANLFYRKSMDVANRTERSGGFNDGSTINGQKDAFSLIHPTQAAPTVDDETPRIERAGGQTIEELQPSDKIGSVGERSGAGGFYGDTAATPNGNRQVYERHLDDYFNEDFLVIDDLQVRGDPVWFLQTAHTSVNSAKFQPILAGNSELSGAGSDATLVPSSDSIIYLKVRPSEQDDYMNPDRTKGSSSSAYIGGFYQVTRVVTKMSKGTFRQTISCSKIAHMNGYTNKRLERL